MKKNLHLKVGKKGEALAVKFLEKKGIKILKQNLRLKFGEIDILAEEDRTLILVEVKTKTNLNFGQPFEMVNYRKKRKLVKLSQALLNLYPDYENIRIDIVSIELPINNNRGKIKYFENAIEAI